MKVLITGGMGEIGKPTARWLIDKSFDVRVLDLRCEEVPGVSCRVGNVKDFPSLAQHMEGMDAVVHLAAIRHPGLAPETDLLDINIQGTVNVFRAAADAGIKRVVVASSINALGFNFGIKFPPNQIQYFPIDEAHPIYTTDPYSFSKAMIEEVGAYFWRREGISSTFLRFPAVYDLLTGRDSIITKFIMRCYVDTRELMALPDEERAQQAQVIVDEWKRRAQAREWELDFDLSYFGAPVSFGMSNFWTGLDVHDAAQAITKSLSSDFEGSHPLFVTDKRNLVGIPNKDLLEVFFPDVPTCENCIEGDATLVSIDKARELIGFDPQYPYVENI